MDATAMVEEESIIQARAKTTEEEEEGLTSSGTKGEDTTLRSTTDDSRGPSAVEEMEKDKSAKKVFLKITFYYHDFYYNECRMSQMEEKMVQQWV